MKTNLSQKKKKQLRRNPRENRAIVAFGRQKSVPESF